MKTNSLKALQLSCILIMLACFYNCDQARNKQKQGSFAVVEIEIGSFANAGIDSIRLNDMTAAIAKRDYPNIPSVLIARNKKLVYENYFPVKTKFSANRSVLLIITSTYFTTSEVLRKA